MTRALFRDAVGIGGREGRETVSGSGRVGKGVWIVAINSAVLWIAAREARDRARSDSKQRLDVVATDAMAAGVMAAAMAEVDLTGRQFEDFRGRGLGVQVRPRSHHILLDLIPKEPFGDRLALREFFEVKCADGPRA